MLNIFVFVLSENGEAIQILRYQIGQKYEPHFDYFHDKANQVLGGNRVATVLMYLSDVKKGGETVFPNSEVIDLYLMQFLLLFSLYRSPLTHCNISFSLATGSIRPVKGRQLF